MLRPPPIRSLLCSAALLAAIAQGCGRVHDLGSDTSSSSSSGSGGHGGAGGAGGGSTTTGTGGTGTGGAVSTTTSTSGTASTTTGTGGGVMEPSGPTKLTIVNGVVDYPAVRICFLPGDTPWPSAATGLPFAASQVADPLSSAVATDSDVTPWVIGGDLTQTAGKTCTEILALAAGGDAGAPPFVARALAVIPKVVWSSNRSLLLVPNGCLGGPGHTDPSQTLACGQSYTATAPTAGVMLAAMSRIQDAGHVSFQVAGASVALSPSDVGVLPNLTMAMPVLIKPGLTEGEVAPKPPFAGLALGDLGALEGVQIQTYIPNSTYMSSAVAFSEIFANGGPGASAVVNGARLTLVAVGAGTGLPTSQWWHKLTWVMVPSDP